MRSADRPNIVVLISDDQAWSDFNRTLMPSVYSELVDNGVLFDRAYVNTSLCCPSRSQILTGLYEHHTGVDENTKFTLTRPTIVEALHDLGYRTSLTGKYLNSWPCTPRPEFDQWVCSGSGQGDYTYVNPTLNVDGTWTDVTGYTTDILAGYAASFIAETPEDQPFFALYTPTSPHLPARDARCWPNQVEPYRPPSWDEPTDADGKPAYAQRPALSPHEIAVTDQHFHDMTTAVQCLDPGMETVLESLGDREQDTLVIYLSDNGFLFGEHRRSGKRLPYEEAVHVPMVIRYPALAPESQPFTSDALVENVDLAATIADLLGIHWGADGTSLVPILTQEATTVRDGALIEDCQGYSYPCPSGTNPYGLFSPMPSYNGVVTDTAKYVEYVTGEKELYDLVADPYEITNLDGDPGHAELEEQLAAKLADLRAPPPVDTTIVSGPAGTLDAQTASFTYFSQSRLATYQCRLDVDGSTGTWARCPREGATVGRLSDGSYTFEVRGTDENGATDPTPDTRSFTVASTGPDVTISSGAPRHQKARWATYVFSSSIDDAAFSCQLALVGTAGSWAPCSSPVTYSGLGDGTYLFQVRAAIGAGKATDPPAQRLVQVDRAGPVFTLLTEPDSGSQFTDQVIEFEANEPTPVGLTCFFDDEPAEDCSNGMYTAADLSLGPHVLTIKGSDELGNTSSLAYGWTVDQTPPTLLITGPPSITNDTTAHFSVVPDEGLGGEFGISCNLDGENLLQGHECGTTTDLTGLSDGVHILSYIGIDIAGNVSAPIDYAWAVDTAPPSVTIVSGPDPYSDSSRATFQFSSDEPGTFHCSLDDAPSVACGANQVIGRLAEGPHTLSVFAADLAGNRSETATWSWTVDTIRPVVTITSGPSDPTTERTATFTFVAEDASPVTFSCELDGGVNNACESGVTLPDLSPESHTFTVRGKDSAGNVGLPASWTWTITAPSSEPGRFLHR